MFLAGFLANLVSLLFLAKEFTGIQYVFDKELWKQMLRYAWPLLILGFAGMINETFDRFILKYLLQTHHFHLNIGFFLQFFLFRVDDFLSSVWAFE